MFREDAPRWKSLLRLERAFDRCPHCGKPSSILTDGESGEMACSACGLVVREGAVDRGPDWYSKREDGREERRGGESVSEVMGDLGRSTRIGREAFSTNEGVKNLRIWDARSPVSKKARNLKIAIPLINGFAEKLSLPDAAVERSVQIYRKALVAGLVRGRSVNEITAASLYFACREAGIPRDLKQVAKALSVEWRTVAASYRLLLMELGLKILAPDALKHIPGIASRAEISEKSRRRAVDLFNRIAKEGGGIHLGKSPASVAAAVLYLACLLEGEHTTEDILAKAAGVTEVTVRNVKKLFADGLVLRVPKPV